MLADVYLNNVIKKYVVNEDGAIRACKRVYPVIKNWSNGYLVEAKLSGSLSKGTAINIGTDADIFISMSSNTPDTLSNMYQNLYDAILQSRYQPRKQNVSIGTTVNGYKIDLVPGRRQSQYGSDHSLYKNKINSWIQTNINTHISYVKKSNRISEIKLIKIWRELHNLDFPSFYLEMAVIDALYYSRQNDIANNFIKVLDFFQNSLLKKKYIDPANTNNIISDDLNMTEKKKIVNQSIISRDQKNWSYIVW